jgi:hypothetical protein
MERPILVPVTGKSFLFVKLFSCRATSKAFHEKEKEQN